MGCLDTYALTSVAEVYAALGEVPQKNGIWVYCSASGATAATCEVTATTIVLIITGGGSAGTNTLTLADADKNTLTELVDAINALTGWKAGLIYHEDADSTDLIPTGAVSCLGSANEITLKVEDKYFIEQLINRATCYIERYCNRKLLSRNYSREVYDGTGTGQLILRQYPVTKISRISYGRTNAFSITNTTATTTAFVEVTSTQVRLTADGTTTNITISSYATITLLVAAINAVAGWTATLLNTDYGAYLSSEVLVRPALYCKSPSLAYIEITDDEMSDYFNVAGNSEDTNYGLIYSNSIFTSGHQNILVDYTAGYTTIPYVLEQACIELVVYKYNKSKIDGVMKSETLGDYSYTLGDMKDALLASGDSDLFAELQLFKRRVL